MTVQDKNKENFINQATEKYKGVYDYSKVEYTNGHTPVEIKCRKHNYTFWQSPMSHLKGPGCKYCYNEMYRIPQDEFLKRAKAVHGDKYDYSKSIYTGANQKVTIICKKCGKEFQMTPSHHVRLKQNCPYCSKRKIDISNPPELPADADWKRKRFILRAKAKYGDAYAYDKVVWRGADWPVTITCLKHGDFNKTPHLFLRPGYNGCLKCSPTKKKSLENFISKAQAKYGALYDYSQVNLADKYATFYCRKHHRIFAQEPRSHLRYTGCKECVREKVGLTQEGFLAAANKKWGSLYDYSKTFFQSTNKPVVVTCPIHGNFSVDSYDHIRLDRMSVGGCPVCASSRGEQAVFNLLTKYKIGFDRQKKLPGYDYRFDFCIDSVSLLIEVDGEQHWREVPLWNTSLKERHARDVLKTEIANAYGYTVERINATRDIKKQLDKILKRHIKYVRDTLAFGSFLEYGRYYHIDPDAPTTVAKEYSLNRCLR